MLYIRRGWRRERLRGQVKQQVEIERVVWRCSGRNGECGTVALEVENRVLEEAETFAMAPRARNSHEVGGKFLDDDGEEFVCRLSIHARKGGMGHLGPEGVS